MAILHKFAANLDRMGMRGLVARAASLGRTQQRFAVDSAGHWLNVQPDCTLVSSSIHTASFTAMRAIVLDAWCHQYTPQPGDVVIDVGSGFGEEAVIFSRLVGPVGRVVAIEAHPETFACLQQSISLSGLQNVMACACALADRDGEMTISSIDNFLGNSVISARSDGRIVQARSLDSLTDELGLDDIAMVKMNIEGAEKLAVQGMKEIAARVRNMAISCHDFVADATGDDAFRSREAVRSFLEKAGFRVTTRPYDDAHPWYRDYIYAARTS